MIVRSFYMFIRILLIMGLLALSFGCGNNEMNTGNLTDTTLRDWPEFLRDSSRTGYVSGRLELPLERVWQRNVDSDVDSQLLPLVCMGNYLIAATYSMNDSPSEKFICLDARNGNVIWTKTVKIEDVGSVSIVGDLAVFLVSVSSTSIDNMDTKKNTIICLEIQTGDKIWELKLPDDTGSVLMFQVCFKDKEAFIVAEKGSVYVVDLQEGKITKKFNLLPKGYQNAYPFAALGGGKLIMGFIGKDFRSREICAIDVESGETYWRKRFDDSLLSFCYYNGSVIVLTSPVSSKSIETAPISVVALDIDDGRTEWSYDMGDDWPSVSNDVSYFPMAYALSKKEGLILVTVARLSVWPERIGRQQRCQVYCINAKNGHLFWKNELEMEIRLADRPMVIIADDIGIIGEGIGIPGEGRSSTLVLYDIHCGDIVNVKEVGRSISHMIAGGDSLFTVEKFKDNTDRESWTTEVSCYR